MIEKEIYFHIDELNRLKTEIAGNIIHLNKHELKKRGADEVIINMLMNDIETIGTAFLKAIKLLKNIEQEAERDTEQEARRKIAERYSSYLDSLD